MKFCISLLLIFSTCLMACNSGSTVAADSQGASASGSIAATANTEEKPSAQVVDYYLKLKNTLTADDTKGAANAGGQLLKALKDLQNEDMTDSESAAYADIAPDAEMNADHISKNAGNIKHQREHFVSLSEDMYDLVKAFGTPVILYKEYCPMKDAFWLSESEQIKNPYYGKEMETCGEVKETIQP